MSYPISTAPGGPQIQATLTSYSSDSLHLVSRDQKKTIKKAGHLFLEVKKNTACFVLLRSYLRIKETAALRNTCKGHYQEITNILEFVEGLSLPDLTALQKKSRAMRTDNVAKNLFSQLKSVKKVVLDGLDESEEHKKVCYLLKFFPNLTKVSILNSKMPCLQKVWHSAKITDIYVHSLVELEKLSEAEDLENIFIEAPLNQLHLFKDCKALKSLIVKGSKEHLNRSPMEAHQRLHSRSLSDLKNCKELMRLRLTHAGELLTIHEIQDCSKLKQFELSNCSFIKSFEVLQNFRNLEILSLIGASSCSLKDLQILKNCSKLFYLNLSGLKALRSLEGIANPQRMTCLKLSMLPNLEQTEIFEKFSVLRTVLLVDCPKVKSLKFLRNNPNITECDLKGTFTSVI